ncbi:MAG TPA: glycoside hydrolase family 9 protein [Verrucomicrobiae bacterium]|nr:glycoside hydrolase family 9 protein [Verrucomicrobiae bacterium]
MIRRFLWFGCVLASGLRLLLAQEYGWVGTNSLAMPQVGEQELRILTPEMIELTLITTKTNETAPVSHWNFVGENFQLKLPPQEEFQVLVEGSQRGIKRIGFKQRPLYAPLKVRDLRILAQLYLELETAIQPTQAVQVLNPSGKLWSKEIRFEGRADPLRFNPAIHVNEVGYQPELPKTAMVGYYLGSLGELKVANQAGFSLIEATSGKQVFHGALHRRPDKGFPALACQNVFEADFSAFKNPGVYRLAIEGMGASLPFQINEGTMAAFARAYALGLYHQRCGTSNSLPFTRFVHDPCHTAPAEIPDAGFKTAQQIIAQASSDAKNDPRHKAPQLKNTDASLYPFVRHGKIDVSGGHHDAGDYSKYTINSAGLIHALVCAADNFEGAGALDNLGIPESGDGKSDLLQEAKWEADFLAKMQDDDGGFYFLVYPKNREYEDNVLPDKGDPQIVWPKNTSATAAATAALAEMGSSLLFKQQFPDAAALYLRKALRGWAFLERAIAQHAKDGAYQKLTHYGNEFLHDDELAWAAAALFAATGEKQYESKLTEWFKPEDRDTRRWTWWPMFEGWGNATRTYVFAARNGRLSTNSMNASFLRRCENLVNETAMNHVRWANECAYGTSFPDLNKGYMTAGWYFSCERAFDMTVAWQLHHNDQLLEAILSNLNYEAGCNPINVCYITGLGWRRQREIVHQYAQNDSRVLPPSGIPLGNIQSGFAYLEHYKKELGALSFPPDGDKTAPYPMYDRWGDSFNTTTEFVIVDQGRSLANLAFWMAATALKTQSSHAAPASIAGLPKSIPVGQTLGGRFEVAGLNPADAQIVWEARDQEPVIAPAFTFAPKNVGEQWVEAEAMWPDGRRAFAQATFNATASMDTPPNRSLATAMRPTAEIVALYHFDGTLKDASGHSPDLKSSGEAHFDPSNLSWMQKREGAALRFKDLGDKATTAIDLTKLPDKSEITIEAMIYINSFKAYNRGNAKILSLAEDWNNSVELIENIYEGPMVKGGTQFSLNKEQITPALTLTNWHHVAISISKQGYSFRVNGKEIGALKSSELNNWGHKPATLEIGNFDGYLDEVAVRCHSGTEPIQTPGKQRRPPRAN